MMGSRAVICVGVSSLVVIGLVYFLFVSPLISVRRELHSMAAELNAGQAAQEAAPLTRKESIEMRATLYSADIAAVGAILSFGSLLAVVVSIIFVLSQTQSLAAQTHHITESLRQSSTAALTDRNFRVHEIFIEHPDLRPYFYDDEPITSTGNDNYLRALAVAGYLLDSFYFVIHETRRSQKAVGAEISADWFQPYIRSSFEKSDVLCSYFDAHHDWFDMDTAGRELKQLRGTHHQPPRTPVAAGDEGLKA